MKDEFIYFDHASTSPLSLDVLEIINSANLDYWGNVSATYKFGINCSTELESIRNNIALILIQIQMISSLLQVLQNLFPLFLINYQITINQKILLFQKLNIKQP